MTLPYAAAESGGQASSLSCLSRANNSAAGMSSLYQCPTERRQWQGRAGVDQASRWHPGCGRSTDLTHIALWIDAEGAAYEVLQGAAGVLDRVSLIHVAAETAPCIGATQKLHDDVAAMLAGLGFTETGDRQPHDSLQFNASRRSLGLRPQ